MVVIAFLSLENHLRSFVDFFEIKIYFITDTMIKNNFGKYNEEEYELNEKTHDELPYIHQQIVGAFRIEAQFLIITSCYFLNNSNLIGGGIYFNINENYEMQYINVTSTIFKFNEAGDHGGSIHLEKKIRKILGNISNCYFSENQALSLAHNLH